MRTDLKLLAAAALAGAGGAAFLLVVIVIIGALGWLPVAVVALIRAAVRP